MAGSGIKIVIQGDGAPARQALQMVQDKIRETAERNQESTSAIAEGWERVRGAVESVGLYMGVRELISGMKELVGGSMELGEKMIQASQRTGLAVDTLSTLHYAAAVTGQDFDGLVNGIGKMNKTIGDAADGNQKAAAFVESLGLNAKELAGRTDGAEIAFHKFVQTLAATEDPIRRNELAMGLLGRAGSAQIPVLIQVAQHWDEFKARAQEAGVALNQDTAEALAQANQRFNDLKEHIQGAGMALTEGMAPGLSQIFSIISGGKSQLDQMNLMGQNLSKTFAFLGEIFYSAGAAAEMLFATAEGGRFTEMGRHDLEVYAELKQKADQLHDLAFSKGAPQGAPLLSGGEGTGGRGFSGTGGDGKGSKGKAPHSDNSISDALASYNAEQARAAADALKAFDQQRLAELETQHRLLLVSDQQYYTEKLALQNEMLDAEQTALSKRQATLQALYAKQHSDKLLKRNKDGVSAEEVRTQTEMLKVQEQLGQIEARRGEIASQNAAEVGGAGKAAELANLRAAAALEKERNDGITAQIALLQAEAAADAERLKAQGGSAEAQQQVMALAQVKQQMLEIGEVARQIGDAEDAAKLKQADVDDRLQKGQIGKRQAEQQLNALRQQEAQQLAVLVEQYDALAQTLGGPFKQKAAELHAELDKLNRPDQKQENVFGATLAKGVMSMADRIVEQSMRGRQSFKEMAKDIEIAAVQLAMKLALLKLAPGSSSGAGGGDGSFGSMLGSLFSGIFGAGAEHHMSGGVGGDGAQVVGEAGPEIWTPPGRGGSYTPSNSLSSKLAEMGGGGAPKVTQNIINQSSQPVTAQAPQVSYDSQMQEFIIHTVLEDHANGGLLAQVG